MTDAGLLRLGWAARFVLGEGRRERERRLAAAIARVCVRLVGRFGVQASGFSRCPLC